MMVHDMTALAMDQIEVCIAGARGALNRLKDEDRTPLENRRDYLALRKYLHNAFLFARELRPGDKS